MDISIAIASAWSLLKDISLGVGANELHRQLVERLQRSGAANLDLQKALYASLLDAVDGLGKTLSSENHPYFLTISDLHERCDEQKRVREIFKEIRAHLPKTGALQNPVTLVLEGSSSTDVKTLLGRVGLESYLESLPESLHSAFESNLPFAMLAHFRRQIATDDRLHALLQLDLTTAGFQAVQRELRAISDFLRQHCGSDDPAKIHIWTENLASDLKSFMVGQLEEVKSDLAEIKKEIKERWDDDDLFRLVEAGSPDKTITRYLEKKAAGQIYVAAKLTDDFTEKLERNGSLLIQGLPGSGKTITGLALAESFHDGRCRLFYITLRHDIDEDTLVKGIRRRLSRPTIFLLDDCHGKFEMLDLVQNRLSAEMRGKGFLVFMARTTPTPEDMPRGDYSDFEESLKEAEATLELQPTLAVFGEIIARVKPHFAGLAKERLRKIFEFTGHDLLLLDQLLETIDSSNEIDQLNLEKVFEKMLKRYFRKSLGHRPEFMKLAALAQFDIAPPVSYFHSDLDKQDEDAATQLVVRADLRLPRYFFLHSSAAELIYRALAWNNGCDDYPELAADYLIEFFKASQESDKKLAAALSNVIWDRLKLHNDRNEEDRRRSRFLADAGIYAFVEKAFDRLPLDLFAVCLIILKNTDAATFERYCDLVQRKIDDGTVLSMAIACAFRKSRLFLSLERRGYPLLLAGLRSQPVDRGLRTLLKTVEFKYFLSILVKLAEPSDSRWFTALDSIPDSELDEMIQRTIVSDRSIGTIHLALRELKETNQALLEKLERKIAAKRYLHLIASAGTIFELFMIIKYSSPSMAGELIDVLDAKILDALITKTIASGRSIGTINLTLSELKKHNLVLLEKLQHKIGARRYLHLNVGAGTIFELFMIIRDSSPSMAGELIDALGAEILDTLITKTIDSGRSIGTIPFALRELKKTSPRLLEKLEYKIGSKRWWQLICANGRVRILRDLPRYLSQSSKQEFMQGSQQLSLAQWQGLLLRSSFADLGYFVRWSSHSFSKEFTIDFLSSLKPTFETLIDRDNWETLDQCSAWLRESSDSPIKKYLSDLLHDYLATVDLDSLRFNSFGEAMYCVHLLWQELPSQRKEVSESLLTILPKEEVWYADEQFLRSARLLFFILANPQARPDDARKILAIGNSKEVAALCAEATTLDLFLYLWNLYSLWFQWERKEDKAFATFLHSKIRDIGSNALAKRLQIHASQEETYSLIALAGLLSFLGWNGKSAEKAGWLPSLSSFDALVKRVQPKTFIPGVFFLLGLEWIFDKKGGVPQQTWRRLLSKAEAYTEKTAALEHLRDFVRARAGSKV